MGSHLFSVAWTTAQALARITFEQTLQEAFGDRRYVARISEVSSSDSLEKLITIPGVVRRQPSQHLVHQSAQGVPVDGLAVTSLVQDLRSEVLGRTAHRLRREVVLDALLAQAEV